MQSIETTDEGRITPHASPGMAAPLRKEFTATQQ